jgi:hypothetical protein
MRHIIAGIAILLWAATAQADERQTKEKDAEDQPKEVELLLNPDRPCVAPPDCGGPILLEIPEKSAKKEAEPMPLLFASLMVTSFADLASTEIALSREGTREANPLMQNQGARVALTVAAPLAVYYIGKKLSRKKRIALYIGVSVGWAYLSVHNLNQ